MFLGSGFKVGFAKKNDAFGIARLFTNTWRKEIGKIGAKKIKRHFLNKIKAKEVFVAKEKNSLLGFLVFTKSYWRGADFLDELLVEKNFQRKGVALKLVKAFEKNAGKRKARRIFSTTNARNKASLRLHKKAGFKKAGYIKNMWGERDTEIVLSKKL